MLVDFDPALSAPFGRDVDDELAVLFMAASAGVRVVSLTATHANAPVWLTCPAAVRLYNALVKSASSSVALADAPVVCGPPAFPAHARQEQVRAPPPSPHEASCCAVGDALYHRSRAGDTVLALGALTNIACALQRHPELASRWKRVVVLGGSVAGGGGAELNLHADPTAARYVLATPALSVEIISSESAMRVAFGPPELTALENCLGVRAWLRPFLPSLWWHRWVMSWLGCWLFSDPLHRGCGYGFFPWDVTGAAWVTHRSLFVQPRLFRVALFEHNHSLRALALTGATRRTASPDTAGVAWVVEDLRGPDVKRVLLDGLCRSGQVVLAGEETGPWWNASWVAVACSLVIAVVSCAACRNTR